ncbi:MULTISPECIES: phage integrase SAM-like domain-containing protein [unclassified Arcicella]|uniref:tyrosine-type recombinase/integrase n=1 Tax=unclassified Arcicella TaxID=2644986 RepID=UPI0028636582|nr:MULTISPECIES: phage integrase SAM-like domain-containing protein [unclassified Arcicella]MDR6564973.1 integrase [Arcicella sp. BE51]MDR6814763.1 integrase [Arcicella sp. BE140]MDR6826209.1 integrase [Arcicella sp. BE139]
MKISFYFKASQSTVLKNEGFGIIYYYVNINSRKSVEKSTKIKCHRNEWDERNGFFVGFDAERRNRQIAQMKDVLEMNKIVKEMMGETLTVETVELNLVDRKLARTFKTVFAEYLDQQYAKIRADGELKHKGNIELSTYNSYLKREKNIDKFLKSINKEELLVSQFNERMCEMFDNYLTSRLKCGQSYATKHLKLIRTVCQLAKTSNIIKVNFTENYKLKHDPVKNVKTLNENDYQLLFDNFNMLTDTERKYIDVFLFMRETLLNYGDYLELEEAKHLQQDETGRYWIIKARKKRTEENNQIQTVPLSKKALEIMEKYQGIDKMPKMNLSTLQKYIKRAFAKVGVQKKVSSKLSRSSGISIAFNKRKLRGELIAYVAGWTSTREIRNYLEIDKVELSKDYLKGLD